MLDGDDDSWSLWNSIKTMCASHSNLFVYLELREMNPSQQDADQRWLAEPVACVSLPHPCWLQNAKGFPVLSKKLQEWVRLWLKLDTWVCVKGDFAVRHTKGVDTYVLYLQHLFQTLSSPNKIDQASAGYDDVLQKPLQPLMHNLESMVYDVFLQDPVKYELYEEACYRAIQDRIRSHLEHGLLSSHPITVIVVGAGSQGPLVDCVLKASERAGCFETVRVLAVEKNPSAVVTLRQQHHLKSLWAKYLELTGSGVTIFHGDMRNTTCLADKADILVSELLGSFGDNELSPECLDGAQNLLKKAEEDVVGLAGISIPQTYTSYLAPISSEKLYRDVRQVTGYRNTYDVPYVVKFRRVDTRLVSTPKPVWNFSHPNTTMCNTRSRSLQFEEWTTGNRPCLVHGFAGYFDCVLYQPLPDVNGTPSPPVTMSIHPDTHSTDMFSWYPMFFPLDKPQVVYPKDSLTVHIWRCVDKKQRKVWYEWCAGLKRPDHTEETFTRLQNAGGESYWIGL
jgi:protein arginine N-methyltransferase 5